MSIEKDSKWVKDGEVVEVVWLNATFVYEYELSGNEKMVWYECDSDTQKNKIRHVLTERDFLEQYKPYEPVYEYRYVTDIYCETKILNRYFTEDEIKEEYEVYQRIDFTKKERK